MLFINMKNIFYGGKVDDARVVDGLVCYALDHLIFVYFPGLTGYCNGVGIAIAKR